MTLVDTKLDAKCQRRRCQNGKDSESDLYVELREEAVKLVTEDGISIPEVRRRLSVSPSAIQYWVKVNREGYLKLPPARGEA